MQHGAGLLISGAEKLAASVSDKRRKRLKKLALRVQMPPRATPLASTGNSLPAGFTYLAQLVAHDMTQIADPYFLEDGERDEISTARSKPLCLETLYGDGPMGTPLVYEYSGGRKHFGRNGRLRLGLVRAHAPGGSIGSPQARDIPRLGCPMFKDADDPVSAGWPCPADVLAGNYPRNSETDNAATEPLLADQRNDDNLLVSQLLTVFIRLHNLFYDEAFAQEKKIVPAFRRARLATTAIYQSILAEELFPALLDPVVWEHYYHKNGHDNIDTKDPVPALFKHGAFRIGHSMVQNQYAISRLPTKPIKEFLKRETVAGASQLPITDKWIIDWVDDGAGFFDVPGSTARNRGREMGPSINSSLLAERAILGESAGLASGPAKIISLTYVDYLRAEMLVGHSLLEIRHGLPESFFPSGSLYHDLSKAEKEIVKWLEVPSDYPRPLITSSQLTLKERKKIAAKAPLPFLVQFEAMGGNQPSKRPQRGVKMGPLGSALIARTVAPVLNEHKSKRMKGLAVAKKLLNLSDTHTKNMGSLVRFLDDRVNA